LRQVHKSNKDRNWNIVFGLKILSTDINVFQKNAEGPYDDCLSLVLKYQEIPGKLGQTTLETRKLKFNGNRSDTFSQNFNEILQIISILRTHEDERTVLHKN